MFSWKVALFLFDNYSLANSPKLFPPTSTVQHLAPYTHKESMTESGAQLTLVRFASYEQQKEYHRNAQTNIHYVIKGTPIVVELGIAGSYDRWAVDFHRFSLECTLLYDNETECGKPVHFLRESPVEYKTLRVSETGELLTVEIKLNALSSKHEDTCFRIRFSAQPPTGSNLSPFSLLSEPVRVVSKVALLKNKKAPKTAVKRGKKRSLEEVADTVSKLEKEQKAQQILIQTLLQTIALMQKTATLPATPPQLPGSQITLPAQFLEPLPHSTSPVRHSSPTQSTHADEFETHLFHLIDAYNNLPEAERATKIRKVVHNPSIPPLSNQLSTLAEIVDAVWIEGLTDQRREL